eukprot:s958_g34.t1
MERADLLHGLTSFQHMLNPIFEVETTLCRLRDSHFQLSITAETLQEEHPDAADALRTACANIARAIAYFNTQKWFLILAFRTELEQINRNTVGLPSLDVSDHHAG